MASAFSAPEVSARVAARWRTSSSAFRCAVLSMAASAATACGVTCHFLFSLLAAAALNRLGSMR